VSARVLSVALAALTMIGMRPLPVAAQNASGRFEISGGALFTGGFDLGEHTAELTSNTGTTGGQTTFFVTDAQLKAAPGIQGRIAVFVTSALAIEGGVRFAKPVLEIRTHNDIENAPDTTATEKLSQYVFEGSGLWYFGERSQRVRPFVYGGAGYLRELHESGASIETGTEYHAGAGVRWAIGSGRFGVRAEGGFSIRDGGVDFASGRRTVPVVAGSLTWRF
jgi:Outer membrane protein beta-barrel domain